MRRYLVDGEKAVSDNNGSQRGDGERRYKVASISIPLETPWEHTQNTLQSLLCMFYRQKPTILLPYCISLEAATSLHYFWLSLDDYCHSYSRVQCGTPAMPNGVQFNSTADSREIIYFRYCCIFSYKMTETT